MTQGGINEHNVFTRHKSAAERGRWKLPGARPDHHNPDTEEQRWLILTILFLCLNSVSTICRDTLSYLDAQVVFHHSGEADELRGKLRDAVAKIEEGRP